jgi:hypothetical protein
MHAMTEDTVFPARAYLQGPSLRRHIGRRSHRRTLACVQLPGSGIQAGILDLPAALPSLRAWKMAQTVSRPEFPPECQCPVLLCE